MMVNVEYATPRWEQTGRVAAIVSTHSSMGSPADIIVDMIYKSEKRGWKYRVTVTGFAGYYKNSRTLFDDIRRLGAVKKEDVEKYLMLHNPEVLQYMYQKDDIVKIYHNENVPSDK